MRVLFVCVENACRSQMAQGFAAMLGGGRVAAFSAGSRPSGKVNPTAIRVMEELGHDMSGHRSEGLDALPEGTFDAVVTMGCGDACPNVPASIRRDWQVPDPKAMPLDEFRAVRDGIGRQVRDLLAELAVV